jgi:hypothetical protein
MSGKDPMLAADSAMPRQRSAPSGHHSSGIVAAGPRQEAIAVKPCNIGPGKVEGAAPDRNTAAFADNRRPDCPRVDLPAALKYYIRQYIDI